MAASAENVTIGSRVYRRVREGSAAILAPYRQGNFHKAGKNNDEGDQAVFYNPIQQFNRDLSVLAILVYGEGAIIAKSERFKKKVESKRNRKKARKAGPDAIANEVSTSRKRHAEDDVQEPQEKRQKTEEFDADEEELAVMELAASNQVGVNLNDTHSAIKTTSEAPVDSDVAKSRPETPFTILDALSATGLRALRYAKEIPFANKIIANDLSQEAIESIELNIDHNGLKGRVFSNVGDARSYMYSKVGNEHPHPSNGYVHRFDVIDLDPYGTAAPFFDAAVQGLQDGGLLCVTSTDAGVFASVGYLEKTYDLYGGIPLKGAHSHEGGLRLLLHAIATSAAKYGIAIEPLLSLSVDFYARLFVRVHKQQNQAKLLAGTTMLVYNCDFGCGSWVTQLMARNQEKEDRLGDTFFKYSLAQAPSVAKKCEHCGSKMHLGGPMWAGPLHNPYFVQRMLDKIPSLDSKTYGTLERLQGMLTVALEEDLTLLGDNNATTTDKLPSSATESISSVQQDSTTEKLRSTSTTDHRIIPRLPPQTIDLTPLFFVPNYLAKVLHCETPSENELRGAIRRLGYRVTRSHCKAGSFKTNAPWSVIWEIFREWVRTKKPVRESKIKRGMPGWTILAGLRGSESARIKKWKEDVLGKMAEADSVEDVKTVLESAMWRLEHARCDTGDAKGNPGKDEMNGDGNGSPRLSVSPLEPLPLSTSAVEKLDIVFDEQLGKEKPRGKLVRYQINPRANWGPMNRAGGQ